MNTALRILVVVVAALAAGLVLLATAGSALGPISGQALAALAIAVFTALLLMLLGESLIEDAVKVVILAILALFAPTRNLQLTVIAPLLGAACGAIGNWILRQLRDRALEL